MAQCERNRSLLDRSNRLRPRQVFAAGSAKEAWRGINRFRKPANCRMLAGCLILATDGPDASGSGFNPTTTFWTTLPPERRAGRPPRRELSNWIVSDDWPECIPVTDAEVDVFEAWFGDLFDELFGPCR